MDKKQVLLNIKFWDDRLKNSKGQFDYNGTLYVLNRWYRKLTLIVKKELLAEEKKDK